VSHQQSSRMIKNRVVRSLTLHLYCVCPLVSVTCLATAPFYLGSWTDPGWQSLNIVSLFARNISLLPGKGSSSTVDALSARISALESKPAPVLTQFWATTDTVSSLAGTRLDCPAGYLISGCGCDVQFAASFALDLGAYTGRAASNGCWCTSSNTAGVRVIVQASCIKLT
jgi:hypothetical protein